MKCQFHPRNDVIGYCSVCGGFGCQECIIRHEGSLYCQRHYRPIAQRVEDEKKQEAVRRKHMRQRLVVRFLDGRLVYGYCLALNPKDHGFHLEVVEKADGTTTGKTVPVRFTELKAVFFVKSFDGHFDKSLRYREWTPEGNQMVVEFKDGEVVKGSTLHRYEPSDARFYLIPDDPNSNNISILVESAALTGAFTPAEHETRQAQKKAETKLAPEGADLSQEETLGDFYFETRNYAGALEQYEQAQRRFPQSHRIRRKILATQYNIGVQHVKRREFPQALDWMHKVLKADPENAHAKKKIIQLRRILDKSSPAESRDKQELDF
jgi:tetratricopeptide (TPR) repeat protein